MSTQDINDIPNEDSFENISASEINESESLPEIKDEWEDILGSGALKRKIVRKGKDDERPQKGMICVVNLECTLDDNTLVEKLENFELELGGCDVIAGLDVTIGLMNAEEVSLLRIEPRLAYGPKGDPPKVPEDSVVYYRVELISFDFDTETEALSIKQRKEKGNKKRQRGNWWYSRGDYTFAIQCYRRALDFLDEVEGGIKFDTEKEPVSDSDLQSLLEDRISVCNNMAAAQIKMELFDQALSSLKTVLNCQPNNVKALFRQAKVYREKNDLKTAMGILKKAQALEPNEVEIQKELSTINKFLKKQDNVEKELARKMFGGGSKTKVTKKNRKSALFWTSTCISVLISLTAVAICRYKQYF